MTRTDLIEQILNTATELVDSYSFWPPEQFGSSDALVPSDLVIRLNELLNQLEDIDNPD